MKSNRNIGMILVAVFLIIYGLMVYSRWKVIRFTEPTEAGREGEFLLLMLWEKGSGFRRRVVGRLCQSPFEDWRLIRLRTQLRRGRQRRRINFPRRRSRIGESRCRHQRCRAVAAGSTRFNATHRSEVTDQCFVTVISNAQRLLPTKYTNHTRRMIHFV